MLDSAPGCGHAAWWALRMGPPGRLGFCIGDGGSHFVASCLVKPARPEADVRETGQLPLPTVRGGPFSRPVGTVQVFSHLASHRGTGQAIALPVC